MIDVLEVYKMLFSFLSLSLSSLSEERMKETDAVTG